tara:strand:+ start:348 stop:695 length:348 start_codon:yes stop_codon:yes gene_type:complete
MADVDLAWKSPASGEEPDGYKVYRKTGNLSPTEETDGFGSIGGANTGIDVFDVPHVSEAVWQSKNKTYTDDTALAATEYHYCVTAYKGSLESDKANALDGDPATGDNKVYSITTA